MRLKFQKINFIVLFLLFITFLVVLLKKPDGNQVVFFLYFFLSVAVFDLSFEAKKDSTLKYRQICWIVLNAMIGGLLSYDTFCQKDVLLFVSFICWTLCTTIINCILLIQGRVR